MTPDLDTQPGSLDERATAILDEVDTQLASLEDDDAHEEAHETLRELGEQANDLVSDSNPKALLEALDTDEAAETEYEELSLPAAMSKSDPDSVIDLRTLLRLSNLPGADDDEVSEHVSELREIRSVTPPGADESETETESAESAKSAESADSSAEAAESPPEQESTAAEKTDAAAESESDPSEKVKQELQGRLDEFREGVRSYRESLTEDDADDAEGDADGGSASGMGSSSSPGHRTGTTFSTVPSRNRVGISGTTRFSTMNPRKNTNHSE